MSTMVPSQCPECNNIGTTVVSVSPSDHDKGGEWMTRVECDDCDFVEWVE